MSKKSKRTTRVRLTKQLRQRPSAHTMQQHYQQSYDIFSEGIRIDPTRPDLWYNRAISCHHMSRHAETVTKYALKEEYTDDIRYSPKDI